MIISSGDCVYKMDYNDLLEFHIAKKADITIACKDMPADADVSRFGVVRMNEDSRITDFEENRWWHNLIRFPQECILSGEDS